jgi:hypothetical protein
MAEAMAESATNFKQTDGNHTEMGRQSRQSEAQSKMSK